MSQLSEMRWRWRVALAGCVAATIALTAFGCGGESTTPPADTESATAATGAEPATSSEASGDTSSSDTPVELDFFVYPALVPSFETVVDAYEKANPNVDITIVQGPPDLNDYVSQLATLKLGGRAPDLFNNFDVTSNRLAATGFSEDLVPWFDKGDGLTRDSFAPAFLSSYVPLKEPEQLTGLPVAADATLVYYNTKIFEDLGLPFPTDDWTYDEFVALALQITEAGNGDFFGFAPGPDGFRPPSIWQAQYQPMIKAFGGYVYDPTTNRSGIGQPEAIQAWELLLEPWLNGTYPEFSVINSATAPTFAGGQYAMEVSVRSLIPSYNEGLGKDWDVVQMPTVNGIHPVGGGSYGLSMSSDGENKDASWAFLNWFYATDGGIKLLEENYSVVPPTVAGIESGSWRTLPPPPANVDAFAAAIDDAVIAPALPGKAQGVLDESVATAVQSIVLKDVSVAEAFQEAEEKVNAALEEES